MDISLLFGTISAAPHVRLYLVVSIHTHIPFSHVSRQYLCLLCLYAFTLSHAFALLQPEYLTKGT